MTPKDPRILSFMLLCNPFQTDFGLDYWLTSNTQNDSSDQINFWDYVIKDYAVLGALSQIEASCKTVRQPYGETPCGGTEELKSSLHWLLLTGSWGDLLDYSKL